MLELPAMKKVYKTVLVNKSLSPTLQAGTERDIEVDSEGTPVDMFWRRRFIDAPTDNCVEWLKETKKSPKPKSNKSPVEETTNGDTDKSTADNT